MVLKSVYLAGLMIYFFGQYLPNAQRHSHMPNRKQHSSLNDRLLDALGDAGLLAALVYIFTDWLRFANYRLPLWMSPVGPILFAMALYILGQAHSRIGGNFSPRLETGDGQALVTQGIYRYVRHPIYAGFLLWGIAQPLMLQNWIAGFAMLATFLPLYWVRVPREERMLLDLFGEKYRVYMHQTGRILPKMSKGY